jgi:hypothetical protein
MHLLPLSWIIYSSKPLNKAGSLWPPAGRKLASPLGPSQKDDPLLIQEKRRLSRTREGI